MNRSFLFCEPTAESKLARQATPMVELPTIESCLKTWRELDGMYRFVLNGDGVILASDEKFFEVEVAGADFTRIGSHMRPTDRRFIARFDHLLHGIDPAAELIPRTSGGHWICQAAPFAGRRGIGEPAMNPLRIALTIRPTGAGARGRWADLRTAFGLTKTEERMLQLMISGESAPLIAGRENVSINTVRTHVRHIHEKLAISDAYELWSRVIDYRL